MAQGVKVGVVGVNFGASTHVPCLLVEGFDVVAIAAAHRERAEEAAGRLGIPAAYGDYRELLRHPGLEAVSVATPPASRHEIVMAALAAGKHVLVEKAFAVNEQQAREMWETAEQSGRTAMIIQPYRFGPARAFVKELLQQGYVGDVRTVAISYFTGPREQRPPYPVHWWMSEALGGGMLLGPGSTLVDSIRDWFGEVTGISGKVFTHVQDRSQPDGSVANLADSDDAFSATFALSGGAWGTLNFSGAAPYGSGGRIDIFGSEGTLQISQPELVATGADTVSGARFADGQEIKPLPIPERFQLAPDPREPQSDAQRYYRYVIKLFAEGVAQGTSPSPNFYDAYKVQQALEAIKRSSETGQWVAIS